MTPYHIDTAIHEGRSVFVIKVLTYNPNSRTPWEYQFLHKNDSPPTSCIEDAAKFRDHISADITLDSLDNTMYDLSRKSNI